MEFTEDLKKTIRETVAKGATEKELDMFLYLCQKYDLDPFLKEIWFIKRVKKVKKSDGSWDYPRLPSGEVDYGQGETIIMTSRDGFLKIAQRHPEYSGPPIAFAVCEGDEFEIDAENYRVRHKFGAKRGKIIGAWAKCDRKGKTPAIWFAPLSEYYDEYSNIWKRYTSAMIVKVAEVFVLKRQFGITGLVAEEELNLEEGDRVFSYEDDKERIKEESKVISFPRNTEAKKTEEPAEEEASDPVKEPKEEEAAKEAANEPEEEPVGEEPKVTLITERVKLGKKANFIEENGRGFRTAQFADGSVGWLMADKLVPKLKELEPGRLYVAYGQPIEDTKNLPKDVQNKRVFWITNIEKGA